MIFICLVNPCTYLLISATPYISKEDTVYEYETLEESDNEVEYKVMTTPKFLSTPQTLLVNEGENIRLPCKGLLIP